MAVTKYLDYNGLLYLWNLLKAKFNTKVDKSAGMGLSQNDFTDALLAKLNGVEADSQVNVIESVQVNNADLSVSSKTVSIPNASVGGYGCTVLSSAVNSNAEDAAATSKAVKIAYDLANGKQNPATTLAGYGITDAYTKSEIDSKVASAVNYRGSVPTYSALPANPAAGDMYNVADTDENYIWAAASGNNPARWDPVGALVNIAAITNNEIDAIFE